MDLLSVSGICFQEDQNEVLKDISFSQKEFQKIAIAGETGSGKSTLMQIIAGLVQPDTGQVVFNNKKVIGPADQLIPGHPGIAYLSQQFELPQFLRVEQVLRYANKLTTEGAETVYEVCQISHLLKRKTNQLSGGERQRIALARLLVSRPKLLLLDEPFSNLDMGHKNTLKAVIQDISEVLAITCMLISHDPHDTLSWAEDILVLKNGRLVQNGSPEQIYRQPVNEYVAALFGDYNLIGLTEKAFVNAFKIKNTGKHLLIRPENFRIASCPGENAIEGRVNKVAFFGSFYEIEVLLSGITVTVKSRVSHFPAGTKIFVSLASEDVCYI